MISSRSLKFARALAEVAAEEGLTRQAVAGLEGFQALVEDHEELRESIRNPAYPLDIKQEIIREIGEKAGFVEIVTNFLCLLLERNKLEDLSEVLEAFQRVLDDMAGVVQVHVVSARSLDESVRDRLEDVMAGVTKSAVKLTYEVDEGLIGGLRVQVGSTVYDGTIQTELRELRRQLAVEA